MIGPSKRLRHLLIWTALALVMCSCLDQPTEVDASTGMDAADDAADDTDAGN